jgi:iron(III) transport system permease protein
MSLGSRTGSVALAAVLGIVIGWPLAVTAASALSEPPEGLAGGAARPLELASETLRLVLLTEAIALPLGVALAWFLFRSDLWGRRALIGLIALALFVPLPLHALAWLGSFGNIGREQALGSGPILVGRFGAAFVHAMAALPWVVLLTGVGLRSVETELEEAALLEWPAWKVALGVTLRRSIGAIGGAALAVAVVTAGEMTVTDLIVLPGPPARPLRTYAEEAYTLSQQGLGPGQLAARATLPQLVVIAILVVMAVRPLTRSSADDTVSSRGRARIWNLGLWRGPASLVVWTLIGSIVALPIYGLVWRAGRVGPGLVTGRGAPWSIAGLAGTLGAAWADLADPGLPFRMEDAASAAIRALIAGSIVALAVRGAWRWRLSLAAAAAAALAGRPFEQTYLCRTILWGAAGATTAVAVAWPLAWKAREPGPWRWVAVAAIALLLAVPGPIAGLSLKMAYVRLESLGPRSGPLPQADRPRDESAPGVASDGATRARPSPLGVMAGRVGRFVNRTPTLMALGYVVRTLPYVLLVLWPALRAIPREYLDSAAVDGLGPWRRLWRVAVPLSGPAIVACWALAFALAIGELPATYFTRAPGRDPVSIYVWGLLHVGVESRLAGAGLILLGVVAAAGSFAALAARRAFAQT